SLLVLRESQTDPLALRPVTHFAGPAPEEGIRTGRGAAGAAGGHSELKNDQQTGDERAAGVGRQCRLLEVRLSLRAAPVEVRGFAIVRRDGAPSSPGPRRFSPPRLFA